MRIAVHTTDPDRRIGGVEHRQYHLVVNHNGRSVAVQVVDHSAKGDTGGFLVLEPEVARWVAHAILTMDFSHASELEYLPRGEEVYRPVAEAEVQDGRIVSSTLEQE